MLSVARQGPHRSPLPGSSATPPDGLRTGRTRRAVDQPASAETIPLTQQRCGEIQRRLQQPVAVVQHSRGHRLPEIRRPRHTASDLPDTAPSKPTPRTSSASSKSPFVRPASPTLLRRRQPQQTLRIPDRSRRVALLARKASEPVHPQSLLTSAQFAQETGGVIRAKSDRIPERPASQARPEWEKVLLVLVRTGETMPMPLIATRLMGPPATKRRLLGARSRSSWPEPRIHPAAEVANWAAKPTGPPPAARKQIAH